MSVKPAVVRAARSAKKWRPQDRPSVGAWSMSLTEFTLFAPHGVSLSSSAFLPVSLSLELRQRGYKLFTQKIETLPGRDLFAHTK